MKMMSEKERKELISELYKFGGIGLRRQSLRVHKNGAKFPISKTYIDDELLDPEMGYTVILIPEIKIATETTIVLSYFARKKGPLVFYAYPKEIVDEEITIQTASIMDRAFKEEFFIYRSSTLPLSLNYYFEIPSEWARGKKEMLMISVMLDKIPNQLLEESIRDKCSDFVSQLKTIKELYKALYINAHDSFLEQEHSDIKKINVKLRNKIKEFYEDIKLLT